MSTPPPLPTPVSFDDTIANLQTLQASFKPDTCVPKEPLISFAASGSAPTLDFNMPQSTAFTTYGRINVPIDEKWFKPFALVPPANNYFSTIQNMTEQQVFSLMYPGVAAADPYSVAGTFVPQMQQSYPGLTKMGPAPSERLMGPQNFTAAHQTTMPYSQVASQTFNYAESQPISLQTSRPVTSPVASLVKQASIRPIMITRVNNRAPYIKYVAKPPVPHPRIIVVEEYTTSSYLGNYGAGKVVKTMSLMPGERTTISVRTYKDSVSLRDSAQNVLDSMSDTSATELDNLMQKEQGDMSSSSDTSGGSSAAFSTSTDTHNSSQSFNVSASLSFGGFGVGGGYGQSDSDASSSAGGWNNSNSYGHTGARSSNVNTINNALSKHVQSSNSNRQINVNTSTSDSVSSGEEDATTRELVNYNKSRVLNFMFRQLLQEYTVITAITNLKFVYTNGYPESYTIVDLNNLENMITDLIADGPDPLKPDEYRDALRCALLRNYCNVIDYTDTPVAFLDRADVNVGTCLSAWIPTIVCPETIEHYWRIPFGLSQSYTEPSGNKITIKGIILSVQKQTLQTSSLIADALLGRGEALDCFNQKAQDAESMSSLINNMAAMQSVQDSLQQSSVNLDLVSQQLDMGAKQIDKMQAEIDALTQQMDVITAVTDPADAVTAYKKVFGSCYPTPQYTGGCGCGGGCGDA